MRKTNLALFALLSLSPVYAVGQAQRTATPCEVTEVGVMALQYNYDGALGKKFTLQLQRPQPGEQQSRKLTCSSLDHGADSIDCSIKGFSGIMHVGVSAVGSYFKIPSATDVHISVRPNQATQCSVQPAGGSN